MSKEEEKFPLELRQRGNRSAGGEWGWKFVDVPLVVSECQKLNYAILGGQTQFHFPDATCELYWLSADPTSKKQYENWADYSKRSRSEFLILFNELLTKTDFEKEGIKSFGYLRRKKADGEDILQGMYFIMYPVSEKHYRKLFGKRQNR